MVFSDLGPPPEVLDAFALVGSAVRLTGGQGTSWRVGDAVLKPGVDPDFQEWLGSDLARVHQDGFRLPAVRRTVDGAWVAQGWGASSVVPGSAVRSGTSDWRRVIAAARALHAATTALPRPPLLDVRADPWALADRVAWGEAPREVPVELKQHARRLEAALTPLGPSQLIHGDLTSNVLITPGGPPSIIDLSPYWRPALYAEGIVVADALCWHGATPEILEALDVPVPAVARGLLFRLLTTALIHEQQSGGRLEQHARRYSSVLDALDL